MTNFEKKIHEIIRVDHAGEFGAKVIYDGQIAALKMKKDHDTVRIVEHMKKQEDLHFDYFNSEIVKQRIRPTVMQPLWRVGGFAMGFVTALLDKRAAMACTTAVEEAIDEHYKDQIKILEKEEEFLAGEKKLEVKNLKEKIEKFREEELEHRDIGYEHHAQDLRYFRPLSFLVKGAVKFAIGVSKKV